MTDFTSDLEAAIRPVVVEVRRARLASREEPTFLADWHRRWDSAEWYYFSKVRPPETFDLVVANG